MNALKAALLTTIAVMAATPARADQIFTATLAGHAVLPAASFLDAPADGPADFRISGKYAGPSPLRIDAAGSVPGMDGERPTGLAVPFSGQPLQGFSGIRTMSDGTVWVISDNGFGSKANSSDAMLMLNHFGIDWQAGRVERIGGIVLHDPDRKVPFRIVHEDTPRRYLTGADFDVESFQPVGGKIWIGEEFGPYLLRVDADGKVEAVFETKVAGRLVRSPDHYAVTTPAVPDGRVGVDLRRSKGYEGMASSKDGRFLYALLEGPLWDAGKAAWETEGGTEYLRILEFDIAAQDWTGRFWKYPLEASGLAIGDFNMIDATTGLVIERDNGEGIADVACPAGEKRADCFASPARFKRIYKIELSDANAGGAVRKIGHIDLMAIEDPAGKARRGGKEGRFTFPFFTIENVDVVDERHIIVANDNNLPFSAGRELNRADDNEFMLLEVGEFLKAR